MGKYTGELKCNMKSVRMTDTVYKYVLAFDGEGFNQKFENLVLFFMENEEQKKSEVERLEQRIRERREELKKMDQCKELMDNVCLSLKNILLLSDVDQDQSVRN